MNYELNTIMEKLHEFFNSYLFTINQTKVTVSSIFWFLLVIVSFFVVSKIFTKYVLNKMVLPGFEWATPTCCG